MASLVVACAAAVLAALVLAGAVSQLTGGTCAQLPVPGHELVEVGDRLAPACAESLQGCP